jgi:hypothetical protein
MMTFDDIQVATSNFKPTLNPGIHEVLILGHELVIPEDATKSKYVLAKWTNVAATRSASIKIYVNDVLKPGKTKTALDIALGNIKHIANACNLTDAEKAKIKGNDKFELLCSMLNACVGKTYRQKFIGEEYLDREGRLQVKVGIGFPNHAESITIPVAESQLLFKDTDPYDYKKLPAGNIPAPTAGVDLSAFVSEVDPTTQTSEPTAENNLPF